MNNIEVELRSQFNRAKYEELYRLFQHQAEQLGVDDKDMHFFIYPDKLLKVVNNLAKKTAKISLKLNKIGLAGNDFEEHEVFIAPEQVAETITIFKLIAGTEAEYQHTFNQRDNYNYKGVEIALKWSNNWGYHLELEKMVEIQEDVTAAEQEMQKLAEELGIRIMTQEELKELTDRIDAQAREGKVVEQEIPVRPEL